jgi:hypothetical protein
MPNNQAENNAYTEEQMVAIERSLSPDRLNSYMIQAKGDRNTAIHLYEQNTELSEALYGVIQGLEVTLRNSMDRILRSGIGFDNWYDHIQWQTTEAEALSEPG